jgi:hypothetical protein
MIYALDTNIISFLLRRDRNQEVVKRFEDDNVWFIDKRSWNGIRKENIKLVVKGIDICAKKYKVIKSVLRKGIRIRYSSMLKLKKFIQFSVIDSIDQCRANRDYFQC